MLTAALAAAAAALTLAAAPPRSPARPATAPTAVTAPVLLAARTSPSPSPAQPSRARPPQASSGTSCGVLDVSCEIGNAITSWFAALARDALRPLLTLAGQTLLSSPQAGAIPAVHSMWTTSLAIADSAYVLLVIIGGVIVMGHETLQTSYSAKDIAPRLVTGFLAANLSLVLISQATTHRQRPVRRAGRRAASPPPPPLRPLLGTLTAPLPGGGIFLVLLALAGAVLALVLVVVYVLRLMALVLLTAAAPLALAAYALPQTAWAARWWWRALTACLAIQVAQALVLTAAVRVFSAAGWIPLHGASGGSVLPVLTAICLLYIMMRIPWWVSRPVLSAFGPSPVRRAVRFAFYAAVMSRVSPLLRGAAGARRPPAAAGGRGRGPAGPRGGAGPRGAAGPGGGGPRGPAAPPGGGPGTGPGTSTGPGRGRPGRASRGARPGRSQAGGAGPQRPGGGPGPRRGPGGPGAPSRGPGGSPRPRPPRPAGQPPGPARARSSEPGPPHRPGRPPASPGRPRRRAGHAPARPARRAALRGDPGAAQRGTRPPGPAPARPRSAWPPPGTPARPRPRVRPCPPGPPPARQPGRRAAAPSPARHLPPPVPRAPEGDHR